MEITVPIRNREKKCSNDVLTKNRPKNMFRRCTDGVPTMFRRLIVGTPFARDNKQCPSRTDPIRLP